MMDAEQAARLREPFPAKAIGKLPKPTKRDNPKGRCNECGGWHGLPAVHLDYVGHAATTDRLLSVDPDWTWEPMAYGEHGEPLMTNGGLWIRLTVCGVTRPGFGDGESPKEIIGDAIRNAAMRFGVALDLWAKEDLHANGDVGDEAAASLMERQKRRIMARQEKEPKSALTKAQKDKLNTMIGVFRNADRDPTAWLWNETATMRDEDGATMVDRLNGRDTDGMLHWAPLRDSLSKDEASSLIDRLERYEQHLAEHRDAT